MVRTRSLQVLAGVMISVGIAAGLSLAPSVAESAPAPAPAEPSAPTPASDAPTSGAQAAPGQADAAPAAQAQPTSGWQTVRAQALGVELKVDSFVLDNGLRTYVVEDHSIPAFALQVSYFVGSRDELEDRTGFAHFFEHMMFKGSENVPDGGHFGAIFAAGGNMNASTGPDSTQYYEVLPSNYLDMALFLEADRMRSLAITQENFENQRNAVKEERGMRIENQPYAGAFLQFFADMWAGSGYGHMGIGSREDLDRATADDVQAFFDQHYVPNNAVLVIAGDVDPAEVKTKVEAHFADIPRGRDREPFPAVDHTQSQMVRRVEDPMAQQPLYVIGWKTVPDDHPDRPALTLLTYILLRGDSSRIARILKDEKKLVAAAVPLSGIQAGGRAAGSVVSAFIPLPGTSLADVQAVVNQELERVRATNVSRKELQKAKNQLTVDTVGEIATNAGRASAIADGVLFYNDPTHALVDLESYQKVTARDLKRVATTYLTDQWAVLEIVPKP